MKALLFSVLLLTACAGQTTNQRFYELVGNYAVVQNAAISYKDQCEAGKLPDNCESVVRDIKKVDKQANDIIQSARSNTDNPSYMAASYKALSVAYTNLSFLIRGE